LTLGAIDIGSNAVRLLIATIQEVDGKIFLKKNTLTRVPIRLGEDVFVDGEISKRNVKRLVKTMRAFELLMEVNGVEDFRACATSAMREASNGKLAIKKIKEEAGFDIDVITGTQEADIILSIVQTQSLDPERNYLYIDVGGGSTEISLIRDGKKRASKSFKVGTIRALKNKVKPETWDDLRNYIKNLNLEGRAMAIGTGGNINKLFKLCEGIKTNPVISYRTLDGKVEELDRLSIEERMVKFHLKPDRADVIVPAGRIYLDIMNMAGIKDIIIPKAGLSDGIVIDLYRSLTNKN